MEEGDGAHSLSYGTKMTEFLSYIGIIAGEEPHTNEVVVFLSKNQVVVGSIALLLLLVTIILYCIRTGSTSEIKKNLQTKVEDMKDFVGVGTRPRFRKRDKIVFYGRKMLRKVKSVGQYVKSSKNVKKRQLVMKFARNLLQMRKDDQTQLAVLEPPSEYLQEDLRDDSDSSLPREVMYMLRSVRVFGHFEKPIFLELCKQCETIRLRPGQFLFKIGDSDENVFVVQSGLLDVFITEADGSASTLKYVGAGDSVTSLLSFCDVLTGHPQPYKTVSAKATEDTIVIKLPFMAFLKLTDSYPETVVRMVQIIMIRLMRVTFTALHHYLGLSSELMTQHARQRTDTSLKSQQQSPRKQRRPAPDAEVPGGGWRPGVVQSEPVPTAASGDADTEEVLVGSAQSTGRERRRFMDMDEAALSADALERFRAILQLPNLSLLEGHVLLRHLTPGQVIMTEGVQEEENGLALVLHGTLQVSQRRPDKPSEEVLMYLAHSGQMVGALAVLSGEASFFSVRAKSAALVAQMSQQTFYNIMLEVPQVVLHVANTVIRRLSPLVRQIDFSLDWTHIEAGKAIYRQGEPSDSTYIVLSGRLRSVISHRDGRRELLGEYARGDLVGIVETLTQTERSTTVMAIRDTEVAKLSDGLINFIKLKYPIVVTRLIELLGHRILGSWKRSASPLAAGSSLSAAVVEQRPSQTNFNTVALLPVSEDVPLVSFSFELLHSLLAIGRATLLTSELIRKTLGTSILEPSNDHRLIAWLAQQEDQHQVTLYLCDNELTPWTQRCIRQADCILIVALAERGPSVGKIEKQLETLAVRTQKELILLHREGAPLPRHTVRWLNMRSWCSSHHHIQAPKRLFAKKSLTKIRESYRKILETEPNRFSDVSRLARLLTGTSVGLVLGGGGARGAAHIGMLKAIQEAGIPIDIVGGVSIGAFMGALYCKEKDLVICTQKARSWSMKMTQLWRQIWDLTYPVTSWFSGRGFNALIQEALGDAQIEDLWLPYFTLTTDITDSAMRVHTHGTLWRYVRSSMSIAGVLPPVPDPADGHLLVDGCYVNNVPADVMRSQMGAHMVLAVDVGSQDDVSLTNYGDSLSGWWLLWKRWNPFAEPVKVPSLPDIQSRLAYVSCVRQLEEVKGSDYCEYIRPPIDRYRTLQFGSFDEIKDVGFAHGSAYFSGMRKAGTLQALYDPKSSAAVALETASGQPRKLSQETPHAPHKFTDLAQMVCRVRVPRTSMYDSLDSDEEEDKPDWTGGRAGRATVTEQGYHSEPAVQRGLSKVEGASKGYFSEVSDVDVSEGADTADLSDELTP
ncbi:neuropathy target esterase sws-like isoform X1 [Amphibalanus amphitrite]|uniref:neuropathy target esterase sws-like isoform X1 n=1 Tax=Amphibalanus amphitrite TaxID=1232801 RepID=UPI001C91CCF8|nr:neuropathy target esterase sws-like isoform X1 [Amphibalanus amphitrite]